MLDFEQFSLVEPAVLVTIVCETVLKESLLTLLTQLKVRNYTVSQVQGAGRSLQQSAVPDIETSENRMIETNLEIRAIVSQELSNVILYTLREQQRDFAILAYRQPVEALIED